MSGARRVEITQTGRGGGIAYHEGDGTIVFSWEFAMAPAVVLIFGPAGRTWDSTLPWAAGRQPEIFDFVGAEVVRQKAAGCGWEVDLDDGVITVVKSRGLRTPRGRSARNIGEEPSAFDRLLTRLSLPGTTWWDDAPEAMKTVTAAAAEAPAEVVQALTARDVTWREVEALAALDSPESRAALDRATRHHHSLDTRLAAAEALHRLGKLDDLETFAAGEFRRLHDPREGMTRALRLAEAHPTPAMRQALLWASWNQTPCAPHCARLLLRLSGVEDPSDTGQQAMLARLDLHNSYFERKAAFDALSGLVGLRLES